LDPALAKNSSQAIVLRIKYIEKLLVVEDGTKLWKNMFAVNFGHLLFKGILTHFAAQYMIMNSKLVSM
jgi:hypothetical protein